MPDVRRPGRARFRWRPWLRALHRDLGYLAVGLTVVYAASGLAVNHIEDWDPNFVNYARSFQVEAPLPEDDAVAAQRVLAAAGIEEDPQDVYRIGDNLEILFEDRSLHAEVSTGRVEDEGQQPRLLLRVANWLHLNRGKKAWTYVADAYAAVLLVLAFTGIFMIAGRKGLLGRGAILVALGAAVPVAYVAWSGGP